MRRRQRIRAREKDVNETLFRTASLSAPLRTSLSLTKGAGGPAWSRSTKAWRLNDEGYLREVPSGCAVFEGARMVSNTVRTTSEDFSNAAWVKTNLTTPSTNNLLCANETSPQSLSQSASLLAVTNGQSFAYGIRAQYVNNGVEYLQLSAEGTGFGTSQYLNVSLLDGSFNAVGCTGSVTVVSSGVYDIVLKVTAVASGSYDGFTIGLANSLSDTRFQDFIGDGVKSVTLLRAWSVDVTRRDASYLPEYVSVGVNNLNEIVNTEDASQSSWTVVGGVGTKTAVLISDGPFGKQVNGCRLTVGASSSTIRAQGSGVVLSGAKLSGSIYVRKISGTATTVSMDLNDGAFANFTISTNWTLCVSENKSHGSSSTKAMDINCTTGLGWVNGDVIEVCYPQYNYGTTVNPYSVNGSVYIYHGAGADGVKYFSTDYTKKSALALLSGFRREIAATNGLLYSRDLTSGVYVAPIVTGTPEILTNNGFSSGSSGWSVSGEDATHIATFSGGTLRFQADTLSPTLNVSQSGVLTVGETYTITFTLSSYTSGTLKSDSFNLSPVVTSTTTLTKTITAVAVSTTFGFSQNSTNVDVTIDSISVKLAAATLAQTATGLDGIANTGTTVTSRQTDATVLQAITLSSADRCSSAYVRRKTGTGNIWLTQDGGSSWTDITSQINSVTYSRVQLTSLLANPSVGFKISTNGDAIEVDCLQNEAGLVATSPIITTTAVVTRNAESLTYQVSGNIDFATGTCFSRLMSSGSLTSRFAVSATTGYSYASSTNANTAWTSYDGTTSVTKTGLDDMTSKIVNRIVAWGGVTQNVTGNGLTPASGSFDGSWGSGSTISIGITLAGTIKDVAIYPTKFTDAQMQAVTK